MQKIKNSLLFFIVILSSLTISCNRYPVYTANAYCNSVTTNTKEIELTTIYRNNRSIIEIESVKLDTIILYDNVGGMWKLETYLVDSTCTTNFKYKLIIDDDNDYSTIKVLSTSNYYTKSEE